MAKVVKRQGIFIDVVKGDILPKISSIFCRFVLREAVPQTEYCCSLKFKIVCPSQNFELATLLGILPTLGHHHSQQRQNVCASKRCTVIGVMREVHFR